MDKFERKSPAQDVLPMIIGTVKATENVVHAAWLISPFNHMSDKAAKALKKASGPDWPEPNRLTRSQDSHAQWFGHSHILLRDAPPPNTLNKFAAVTNQTDAWVHVRVVGPDARAVLSRMTPLDIRAEVFPVNSTARCEIDHMAGAITCTGEDAFELMVFRSMAKTLVLHLKIAMESVAALT